MKKIFDKQKLMKEVPDKQKLMKNKIILKNKKFKAVFKEVNDKKFIKIHKYLTRLEDVSSVKKMISKKDRLVAMKKKLEEKDPEYGEEHENYSEEYEE